MKRPVIKHMKALHERLHLLIFVYSILQFRLKYLLIPTKSVSIYGSRTEYLSQFVI